MREDCGLDYSGSCVNGEKWLNFRNILKIGLDIYLRLWEREVKDDFSFLGLNKWKNKVVI